MKHLTALLFAILFSVLSAIASVLAVENVSLKSTHQQALYAELIDEFRCLVCANQTLSDSSVTLAKDLRRKIAELISQGKSRAEIIDYMVARYGEYVLYRPRFSATTMFLWVTPFLVLLVGGWIIMQVTKSRRNIPYSNEQLRQARALLKDEDY